ncbi:MAG: TIGR02597 family protein [Opitutaceae bacterium]|jgi:hypothetical protein
MNHAPLLCPTRPPSFPRAGFHLASAGAILFSLFLTCMDVSASTSAATTPVGVFTVTIAAGTGTGATVSTVSFPLAIAAGFSGAMTGRITGVTASGLSNSAAGWTAGELSAAAAPCLIQITSGPALGRTFLLSTTTANTATTVTLNAEEAGLIDLTTLGIATGVETGDTYRILACDTISSVFGTPETTGVKAASAPDTADNIQILSEGTWLRYYYSSTYASWRRVGPDTAAANIPLRPDTLILYTRRGTTDMSIPLLGAASEITRRAIVRPGGITALASGWPVSGTLAGSALQSIPGWNAASDVAGADRVWILVSGAWLRYYYDGASWRRVGPNTVADTLVIPAGSGVLLDKITATASASTLVQSVPYDL